VCSSNSTCACVLMQVATVPTNEADTPCYEVKATSDRGLGLFETCTIPAGVLFLKESPLMRNASGWLQSEASFQILSQKNKEKFMALHARCSCNQSPCQETPLMLRWDPNSFELPGQNIDNRTNFIYEIGSRINVSTFTMTLGSYPTCFVCNCMEPSS
jgi:hypothetical protein